MARFPCDSCRKPFRGRAVYLYLALLKGNDRLQRRFRLCRDCSAGFWESNGLERVEAVSIDASFSPTSASDCIVCASELNDRWALFATQYDIQSDREDFFGELCGECAHEKEDQLLLSTG